MGLVEWTKLADEWTKWLFFNFQWSFKIDNFEFLKVVVTQCTCLLLNEGNL